MPDPAARPATLLPPPLIYAVVLFAAYGLNTYWPWPVDLGRPGQLVAWVLIALGLRVGSIVTTPLRLISSFERRVR